MTGKILTDHTDPTNSIIDGLKSLTERDAVDLTVTERVFHGTTLVTNAVLQRRGARTALLVTEGFRNSVEIGTEHRFDLYDLNLEKPAPLVPRRWRRPVRERILADGTIEHKLDRAQVENEVRDLLAQGVEAFAVCLLHSYRNSVHERRVRDIIRGIAPDIHVSLSSEIAPEIREYERGSTVSINAYVAPIVAPYLRSLGQRLGQMGIPAQLLIMQSNGGICSPEVAEQHPVRLLDPVQPPARSARPTLRGWSNGTGCYSSTWAAPQPRPSSSTTRVLFWPANLRSLRSIGSSTAVACRFRRPRWR